MDQLFQLWQDLHTVDVSSCWSQKPQKKTTRKCCTEAAEVDGAAAANSCFLESELVPKQLNSTNIGPCCCVWSGWRRWSAVSAGGQMLWPGWSASPGQVEAPYTTPAGETSSAAPLKVKQLEDGGHVLLFDPIVSCLHSTWNNSALTATEQQHVWKSSLLENKTLLHNIREGSRRSS